jgi:hypothetical protein
MEELIKMDFNLKTQEERVEKVKEIISTTPKERLTTRYLNTLTEYIFKATDTKSEKKKQYSILTDNKMVTVNDRETSFEGLAGKLENGEDGIYNMIANDKNIIFKPKAPITQEDLDTIPALKELCDEIEKIEAEFAVATGKRKYLLKKQLMEMHSDKYVIRSSYRPPLFLTNLIKSQSSIAIEEKTFIENHELKDESTINLYDERHISIILCNYSKLKEDSWDNLNSDMKWLMEDFDNLTDAALKDKHPLYYQLLIYKIDGKTNAEIQSLLFDEFGVKHSVEYISSLWRNKIPKLIAEENRKQFFIWYYTYKEKGQWKKCSRCGQIKLAHNIFFSKNNTSKDGWYSICKECRNKKG